MSTTHERHETAAATRFDGVLVGVDGSPGGYEAARQAARLVEADGRLTLLATYDPTDAIVGGTALGVPVYYDEDALREAAKTALLEADTAVTGTTHTAKLGRGRSCHVLLAEIGREQASLVAVGAHGHGRLAGIVLGSTVTELVHRAPCSVLVARPAGPGFPARIVVGVDASDGAAAASATAHALADRCGASLHVVTAEDDPVSELLDASADADLLIVGSRGLHGVRALGSVSERVAHRAGCSVLVVR